MLSLKYFKAFPSFYNAVMHIFLSDLKSSFKYFIEQPQFFTASNTISLSYFRRSDAKAILSPYKVTA